MVQPKVAVSSGRIIGAEALVRWNHPARGLLSADEFVPIAEHTALLRPLTLWVLDRALRQCRRWRDARFDMSVAVNLSVRNLLDLDLPHAIERLLSRPSAARRGAPARDHREHDHGRSGPHAHCPGTPACDRRGHRDR